ncbi:MAG: hypothetical protein U9N06_04300 [candidate division WOR-3 bacterium]|nr:hypothetical protein [candidate division WOR-3 bacterium]
MIKSFNDHLPIWLTTPGPYSDIVILTKVSLYRDLCGYNFNTKTTDEEKEEILELLIDGIHNISEFDNILSLGELKSLEKRFLVERSFISNKEMIDGKFIGLALNKLQNNILVLNSEEHLKISSISPGFTIQVPFNECDRLDDELGDEFDFVYDKELGFLTSSINKVGTGMEISVLIHLPAVVITGGVGNLLHVLEEHSFSIQGIFKTKDGVQGSLFKIKNEFTLGLSEEEIMEKTEEEIKKTIQMEIDAREYLIQNVRYETEDKIWRSYGIIKNARVLNLEDFLNLTSAVRLGVSLGFLKDINTLDLNRWMIQALPGHIRIANGDVGQEREENILRANIIRKNLGG